MKTNALDKAQSRSAANTAYQEIRTTSGRKGTTPTVMDELKWFHTRLQIVAVDAHELFQPQLEQVAPTAFAVVDVNTTSGIFLPGMAHTFVYKPVFLQLAIRPVLVRVQVEP